MSTALEFTTPNGGTQRFDYTGIMQYCPNRSSMCGSGSDEWMLLCEREGHACILSLSYSSEYGKAVWSSLTLPGPAARWLEQAEGLSLGEAVYSHYDSQGLQHNLHPTDLERIREIIVPSRSRIGPLTDADYFGI